MSERKLTFIIVPHGDLETRSLEISYRRLKLILAAGSLLLATFVGIVATWFYVASQALQVPALNERIHELEGERAEVLELARTLAQVEERYAHVRRLLGADAGRETHETWLPPLRASRLDTGADAAEGAMPESWPLADPGYVTRNLTAGDAGSHPGLDIAVPHDTYIRASGAGIVRLAGQDSIYGKFVLIDHGNGYESMYGHASRLFVADGAPVERNEVIALSGSTGRSTAPHLHFEIRKDGEAIDPLTVIRRP